MCQPREDSAAHETVRGTAYGTHFEGRLPAAFADHLLPAGTDVEGGTHVEGGTDVDGGTDAAKVARRLRVTYQRVDDVAETEPLWESEPGGADTPGRFTLERLDGGFRLLAWGAERGVFDVRPDRIGVRWADGGGGGSTGPGGAAAHAFFAYTVPLWLESVGVPVLHGSAVVVDGRAVGLVAPSGTGKSVLCAELVRRGAGFLADDGLAIEPGPDGRWLCLAGPPLLRLWPSGLRDRLEMAAQDLPRVYEQGDKRRLTAERLGAESAGGGTDAGQAPPPASVPLAALYFLHRRAAGPPGLEVARRSPREALVHLIEHGVAAAPAAALGLAPHRLERLAEVAEAVPARHLSFAGGGDSATEILARVHHDLARAPEG